MRSLDCVIDLAEKFFALDENESEVINKFLIHAKTGISAKDARSLKLKRDDPRSLTEYFHELSINGDDRIKYYKYSNNIAGLTSDEIEDRASKSALKYPSLFVCFIFILSTSLI